jgi:hypothetical protein
MLTAAHTTAARTAGFRLRFFVFFFERCAALSNRRMMPVA